MNRPSVITVANEQVSIVTVCQMVGLDISDDVGEGRSRKLPCPFGEIYHSDHGRDPAMRLYMDSNSAYCFSCQAYWTPVSLFARAMDLDHRTAATRLLDRIGYKPVNLAQAWKQAVSYAPELDKAALAEALKIYCRRIEPQWSRRQFDPGIAQHLTRCLSILSLVRNETDADLWLTRCKEVMRQAIHSRQSTSCQPEGVRLRDIAERGEGSTW